MFKKNIFLLIIILPFYTLAQQMWINEIHYDNTGGDQDYSVIQNGDAPAKYNGDYSQLLGMSDHDGLIVYFDLSTILETIFLNGFE